MRNTLRSATITMSILKGRWGQKRTLWADTKTWPHSVWPPMFPFVCTEVQTEGRTPFQEISFFQLRNCYIQAERWVWTFAKNRPSHFELLNKLTEWKGKVIVYFWESTAKASFSSTQTTKTRCPIYIQFVSNFEMYFANLILPYINALSNFIVHR